jgi:hypothetical protein
MTRKNLGLVLCGALASWGCAPTHQPGGRADRPDSPPTPSTGGTGGADAAEPGEAAGSGASDAAPPDAVALQQDASGADSPERSCAGGAIAFNANVPANHDPAVARVMVDFSASAGLPVGNSPRTIELWAFVRSSSWAGDANTIFEYGLVKPNQGFGLDFGGKRGSVDPYSNGSFDNDNQPTGLDPTKDQWVHFAMTYDGTAVVLYVNGVQDATHGARKTSPGNMLATATTPLTIGGNPRGAYFNGYLDEVRLWNVARSQAEIVGTMKKPLTGNEPGLVGYWKFDETSGTVAADSTTRPGHTRANGTLMAASAGQLPAWIPSTAPLGCP